MTIKQDLIEARAMIANIDTWTQEAGARNSNRDRVRPWAKDACCWCADGAIAAICKSVITKRYGNAKHALLQSAMTLFKADFVAVNDGRNTIDRAISFTQAHANILRCLDHAIANATESQK